jgi:hypothetical protein
MLVPNFSLKVLLKRRGLSRRYPWKLSKDHSRCVWVLIFDFLKTVRRIFSCLTRLLKWESVPASKIATDQPCFYVKSFESSEKTWHLDGVDLCFNNTHTHPYTHGIMKFSAKLDTVSKNPWLTLSDNNSRINKEVFSYYEVNKHTKILRGNVFT